MKMMNDRHSEANREVVEALRAALTAPVAAPAAPAVAAHPLAGWPIAGIRVDYGTVVIVAKGNERAADHAARWMCGELLAMKSAAPTAQPEPITGWRVIGPDGSVFEDETPFKAAVLANRHRVKIDPVAAKQFTDAIDEMAREGEAENARLIAEHGSLDCPACGGSGHVGDVAEPSDEAILAEAQQWGSRNQVMAGNGEPLALWQFSETRLTHFARAVLALRGTTK